MCTGDIDIVQFSVAPAFATTNSIVVQFLNDNYKYAYVLDTVS